MTAITWIGWPRLQGSRLSILGIVLDNFSVPQDSGLATFAGAAVSDIRLAPSHPYFCTCLTPYSLEVL
jgi:uncharacterized caspase-like protein